MEHFSSHQYFLFVLIRKPFSFSGAFSRRCFTWNISALYIRLLTLSIFRFLHKLVFLFIYVFFQMFHVEHYISLSTRFLLKCFTWSNLLFRFFRSDISRGTSPFPFHVFHIKHNFFPSFRYSSVNYIGNWITEDSRLLS